MKDLEYKGFIGSVEYDEETQTTYGKVKFIKGLITYESVDGTIPSLINEFQNSVEEYLEDCKEMGVTPLSSATGICQVRLGPELHYRANVVANEEGVKLNELIKKSVSNYIDGDGIHIHKTEHRHTHNHNYLAKSIEQVDNKSAHDLTMAEIFSARERAKCH